MKITNSDYPAPRRARVKPEWNGVLERLITASHLHEIACPRSPTLEREISLFQYGPAILSTSKRFDGDLRCNVQSQIEGLQLNLAAKAHATSQPVKLLHRNFVYLGDLNAWSNWFRIEASFAGDRLSPESVRSARDSLHTRASSLFQQWAVSKSSLRESFDIERRAMGRTLVRKYFDHCHNLQLQRTNKTPFDLTEWLNPVAHQMAMIRYGLEGPDGSAPQFERVLDFAISDEACDIPTNRIRSALYAYQAWQIACGMNKPIPSMWFDVELISTMLPYVDAILVEGHLAEGLRQVRHLLPRECDNVRVFSIRYLSEFIIYLDQLIAAVPRDQQTAANALYGALRTSNSSESV